MTTHWSWPTDRLSARTGTGSGPRTSRRCRSSWSTTPAQNRYRRWSTSSTVTATSPAARAESGLCCSGCTRPLVNFTFTSASPTLVCAIRLAPPHATTSSGADIHPPRRCGGCIFAKASFFGWRTSRQPSPSLSPGRGDGSRRRQRPPTNRRRMPPLEPARSRGNAAPPTITSPTSPPLGAQRAERARAAPEANVRGENGPGRSPWRSGSPSSSRTPQSARKSGCVRWPASTASTSTAATLTNVTDDRETPACYR